MFYDEGGLYALSIRDRERAARWGLLMAWCGSLSACSMIFSDGIKWAADHASVGVPGIMLDLLLGTALVNLATATGAASPLWIRQPMVRLYVSLLVIMGIFQLFQIYFYLGSAAAARPGGPEPLPKIITEWWNGHFSSHNRDEIFLWACLGAAAGSLCLCTFFLYALCINKVGTIHRHYIEDENAPPLLYLNVDQDPRHNPSATRP